MALVPRVCSPPHLITLVTFKKRSGLFAGYSSAFKMCNYHKNYKECRFSSNSARDCSFMSSAVTAKASNPVVLLTCFGLGGVFCNKVIFLELFFL